MAKKSGTSSIPQDDVGDGPGTTRGRSRAADAAAEAMAPGGARPARGGKAPGTGVAVGDQPASVTRTRAAKAGASAAKPVSGTATKTAAKTAAKPAGKSATRSGAGKKRETFDETVARRKEKKEVDQLQADLRAFAIARPGGWNHEDWLGFLDWLRQKGHDLSSTEEIGSRLERERLGVVLSGIQGIGPKRVDALVNRFLTLYSARHASVEEFAGAGLPRADAERVLRELQERYP